MRNKATGGPVIIIGAGLGGLAAAIRLAAHGRQVIVLEKNERVGGKLNTISEQGYTFDIGPSLLTMPWVLRELLAVAGVRLEDELELMPLDPTSRYRWPDGVQFDAWSSLPRLLQEVERIEPADVQGLLRFLTYSRQIYEAVAGPFMLRPVDGLRDMLNVGLRHTMVIDPLRTVDQAVRSFFRSPYLRQLFNRYATYNGSSPYQAPATFNVIPYVEMSQGCWYVRGGMYQIARALERAACRLGVTVRTNAPVARIRTQGGNAAGVTLAGGGQIDGSCIIVNADPSYAYRELLPERRAIASRLSRLELSSSGFILLLGVSRTYPALAHHTIFFSADYPGEFRAIFEMGAPPADPTVYVNVTSPVDCDHAPPGHMNLFVLVNAPAHTGRINWEREAAGYGELVIRKLERMGLTDLSESIVYQRAITPAELAQRYNAPGGAIYGLASNSPWTAFLRPPQRARDMGRLYFAGGGTHPGGGIPLVLLSGRAVVERVLADQPGTAG